MKKLMLKAAVAAVVFAGAAQAEESFPVFGAVTTTLTTNQAELRPVANADPGFFQGSVTGSVFYTPTSRLFLSSGVSFFKNIDPGQAGQGTVGATTYGKTQIQDFSVNASYMLGKLGPAIFQAGLGASVPLSENSRAVGLVTAISPSIFTQISLPAKLALQAAVGTTYNVTEDATQQIDCSDPRFRNNCAVSGADLGNPNTRLTYGGFVGLVYLPIKGLVVNVRYSMGGSLGAVEFENDENTPQGVGVQDGTQFAAASHATRFAVSYGLAGLWSGGQEVELDPNIDPSLQMGGGADAPFWTRFTINLSMSTRDLIYARDRSDGVRITVPVYDFETNTGERTLYSLGISYNI